MLKKILAMLLAASVLTGALAACSGNDSGKDNDREEERDRDDDDDEDEDEDEDKKPSDTTVVVSGDMTLDVNGPSMEDEDNSGYKPSGTGHYTEIMTEPFEDDDPSFSDNFVDADFEGREFKFLHYGESAYDFHDRYIWNDGYASGVIEEAVAERNKLVEEKYNVKITAEECAPMSEARKRIQAGMTDFNLIYEWGIRSNGAALDGMLYDFHDLDYVDFTQSYWVPSAIEGLTVADKMFVATNMISMNSISWAGMYFFNKMLMDKLNFSYPYDYVDAGNWTYDVVLAMCLKAEEDVNGDGIWDRNDQYGGIDGDIILAGACDAPLYEANDDGSYKLIPYTEGMVAAYDQYKDKTASVRNLDVLEFTEGADISMFPSEYAAAIFLSFGEDHYLFMNGSLDMTKEFENMKSDYGVAPVPVAKAGDDYSTGVDYCAPMFSMPVTLEDPDMTAIIMEYMAYESERLLLPAYYETTLKIKRMQDTRDYVMLDIIRDSIKYDWTVIYMWDSGLNEMRSQMLAAGNFTSVAKKWGPKCQAQIDETIEKIRLFGY